MAMVIVSGSSTSATFSYVNWPTISLLFGFFAKDYVVSIRKETDHASVIVW